MNIKFENRIFIECKTDKVLVLKLGFKKCVICAGGIGEVCNKLKESINSCGLVDEDTYKRGRSPPYMENLLQNYLIQNNHDIKIAYDQKRNNYLIVLCPDRETWIIQTARVLGISLRNYKLPDDTDKFKMITLANPNKVEKLLEDILAKSHPRVNELKNAFKLCESVFK